MPNPYTAQTIASYNSSPPADDGSQVASNQVTWAGIKTKLGDPVKTLSQGIDSAVTNMGAVVKTQGLETIGLPAGSWVTRSTLGATGLNSAEGGSNRVMRYSWGFTATARKHVQSVPIAMPRSWNKGTINVMISWQNSATGTVVWGIQGFCFGDGDTYDASFGTAVQVSDDAPDITTLRTTALSSNITVAGSPAEDDLMVLQLYNDCTATAFTATGTLHLVGVRVYFTSNSWNDATATA